MRSTPVAVSLVVASVVACRSSDPAPSCPPCGAGATCVQLACVCSPSHVGNGLTCAATGLEPGAPWPAERGNAGHSGQSIHVATQTGTLRWRFATDEAGTDLAFPPESPAIGADGTLYATSRGTLYAIRPDGTRKWSYADPTYSWGTPALGADGRIYVHGTYQPLALGRLAAFDASSTDPVAPAWTFDFGSNSSHSPVIGADGTLYVAAIGGLFAVNRDGTERWSRTDLVLTDMRSPAIAPDGTVYVVGNDGVVHAIRPDDGATVWAALDVGERGSQPVIGADGTLYAIENHGTNVADRKVLAIRDRTIRWSWTGAVSSRLAVGADGTVYVVGATTAGQSPDTPIYALDPAVMAAGGTAPKWVYDPPRGTDFSTPVIGADGTVYVGDDGSQLHAIGGGRLLWSRFVSGTEAALVVTRVTPAVGADGTIYIGDGAGYLNAFGP